MINKKCTVRYENKKVIATLRSKKTWKNLEALLCSSSDLSKRLLLFLYFVSLGAFLALNYLEANLVTLIDCDTGLQASYVNKIVLTVVACYESKALDSVEKLYCSIYHF